MKSDDFTWEIAKVLAHREELTSRRDAEKTKAAWIRFHTAWELVEWKIADLEALNRLRDAARAGHMWALLARGDFTQSTVEARAEQRDRLIEVRVILAAFVSEAKVLLDVLSIAVATTLGNPGGFKEKHGDLGVRLREYAELIEAPPPDADLVRRAEELNALLSELRDKVVVHPHLRGAAERAFMQPQVGETTTSWSSRCTPKSSAPGSPLRSWTASSRVTRTLYWLG